MSVCRLWYFITSVNFVIYKHTVQENLGSFLAAARLQWPKSEIVHLSFCILKNRIIIFV